MPSSIPRADARLPRYQQIRDDIAARIVAGEWKAGDCIDSESELSAAYQVAVGTIRRAIDRLEHDGLIVRVHGRGMFVRRADLANSLYRFFRLASAGPAPLQPVSTILLRELSQPSAQARQQLQLAPGAQAVRMLRIRSDAGVPLLREEIWLSAADFGPVVELEPAELMPLLYPAYERHFGKVVAKARERLSVETADAAIAADLGAQAGATVVRIERLALDHARHPLEWRVSHGLAGRFVYEAEIS